MLILDFEAIKQIIRDESISCWNWRIKKSFKIYNSSILKEIAAEERAPEAGISTFNMRLLALKIAIKYIIEWMDE